MAIAQSSPVGQAPETGVKAIVSITKTALDATPIYVRAFVYVGGVASILAIILTVILAFAGQAGYALGVGIAGFVLLALTLPCILWATVSFLGARAPGVGQTGTVGHQPARAGMVTWTRRVLRLALSSDDRDMLLEELANLQSAAFMWLTKRVPDANLRAEEVRANIFLADYNQAEGGIALKLAIPQDLHVGMDGHNDAKITFWPWQGLTGRVFVKQEWLIAQTFATAEGKQEFQEVYQLTEEQKRTIHPELRWIVSFPLTIPSGERRKAVGVLNVDGLRHQFEKGELNELVAFLTPKVMAICDKVAQLPTVLINIIVEG